MPDESAGVDASPAAMAVQSWPSNCHVTKWSDSATIRCRRGSLLKKPLLEGQCGVATERQSAPSKSQVRYGSWVEALNVSMRTVAWRSGLYAAEASCDIGGSLCDVASCIQLRPVDTHTPCDPPAFDINAGATIKTSRWRSLS